MDWNKIKDILTIVLDYFKAVFAFWFPEETKEAEDLVNSFKPAE